MCYDGHVQSTTSSFRISKELSRRLSHAAQRCRKGKNAILIEALSTHLSTLEREWLAAEARRQSELVSQHEREHDWYELADTSGWK
jgi:predicted DNA-binding protein